MFHIRLLTISGFKQLAFVTLLFVFAAGAFAQVPVPELTGPVIDQTQTLSTEQVSALDEKLRAFAQDKGSQIQVLIVATTQPEAIEQYSIRVVEAWKLGRANQDDGVLLLVAKEDRGVRIEVGYGLEGAIPDVIANRIIQQVIVPSFRKGDFAGGIQAAVERLIAAIEAESLPAPTGQDAPRDSSVAFGLLIFLLLGMLVIAAVSVTSQGSDELEGSSASPRRPSKEGDTKLGSLIPPVRPSTNSSTSSSSSSSTRRRSSSSSSSSRSTFGGWKGGGGGFGGGGASGKW